MPSPCETVLGLAHARYGAAVHQHVLRSDGEVGDDELHRSQSGMVDIDAVDSSTSSTPTATAAARSRISTSSRRRVAFASSAFESSTAPISVPGKNITAAATTGPASGPIPTSSTPAICVIPARHRRRSKWSMASIRARSFFCSAKRRESVWKSTRAPERRSRCNLRRICGNGRSRIRVFELQILERYGGARHDSLRL